MPKIRWVKTFEIGVPAIDDGHRQMMSIMQSIESTAERRQTGLCVKLLNELLSVSQAHFQLEENLLRDLGYDDLDDHIKYHGELYSRANAAKRACENLESDRDLQVCCEEIMSFLIDDVIRGDMPLKTFFEEKGLAERS